MPTTRKLILDVLKPHKPNALDFSTALAALGDDYRVTTTVTEVDRVTESTIVTIEGNNLCFDDIKSTIEQLGASIHSIDEVEVHGSSPK
ncbi:DUF211 domain-containing protein [Desulfopila sp. IMCC35008]|uniref:DUF211 domain-containing protein n=1 Tax=Desulfopila sp. IMCC35008 TaxID=2653858 RepID=UPI0013D1DF48|nr:DUF211 domain-containing protein [Desulfopila sp. IMCC35008]